MFFEFQSLTIKGQSLYKRFLTSTEMGGREGGKEKKRERERRNEQASEELLGV